MKHQKDSGKGPAGPATVTLACGCVLTFRAGVEGSPVTLVVTGKGAACGVDLHVAGLPVYDHREALRPATRPLPANQADQEEEG